MNLLGKSCDNGYVRLLKPSFELNHPTQMNRLKPYGNWVYERFSLSDGFYSWFSSAVTKQW